MVKRTQTAHLDYRALIKSQYTRLLWELLDRYA
jgi:hypothetical protein